MIHSARPEQMFRTATLVCIPSPARAGVAWKPLWAPLDGKVFFTRLLGRGILTPLAEVKGSGRRTGNRETVVRQNLLTDLRKDEQRKAVRVCGSSGDDRQTILRANAQNFG